MPTEPKTLTIHDNPARRFHVANESDITAEIEIEYRGGGWWRAELDFGAPEDRPYYVSQRLSWVQQWAARTMEDQADIARAACKTICGTDGEDTSGHGNFACGVMSPHGVSVGVSDADGNDLLQDYLINGV
jgi:hypothetical protein